MAGPVRFIFKTPPENMGKYFKEVKDEKGVTTAIKIKVGDGYLYIGGQSGGSSRGSSHNSFHDYTKTIARVQEIINQASELQKQTSTGTAQRRTPDPQRQAPAESAPRPADSQRQPPSENVAPRASNEPAPLPRGGTLPSPLPDDGERGLPVPSKGGGNSSLPLMNLGPSVQAPKGSPPPQEQGPLGEKKGMLYQQVLIATRLFSASEKGGGSSFSASRTSLLLQQFKFLSQDCGQFDALVKQMAAQGKGISPEQTKQLNAAFQILLKQFEGLQKQASLAMLSSSKPQSEEALPKDLQKAIATLKEQSDKTVLQMQKQLDGQLAKLAGELNTKSNTNATPPSLPSPEKEGLAKSGQKSAAELASSSAAIETQSEKGSKQTTSLTFSLSTSASESAAQVGAEAKTASKPSAHLPQFIQSSAELNTLNDKLQRKDLIAPLNVAIVYPFNTKEQNQSIGGVKTGEGKRNEGQNGEGHGGGGAGGNTQEMVLIPTGPVIFEGPFLKEGPIESQIIELNAFLMAAFPVTNEQFADWLNEAMEEGKIKIDEKGIVRDFRRNVLCKIHRGTSTSQIDTEVVKEHMVFKPLKGTGRHPVVQVSWYGATTYCNDNHFRLPTEAEWEKAAGMSVLETNEPLKKFRFGFGKDQIDLSWANYRDELSEYTDNRTSPVGFYNGETVFTKGGKNYKSQLAISPHGCYDMSGNVRQWVNEEMAKGGSYNSPPSELVLAARSVLSPESCYSDTGFRVAFDLT